MVPNHQWKHGGKNDQKRHMDTMAMVFPWELCGSSSWLFWVFYGKKFDFLDSKWVVEFVYWLEIPYNWFRWFSLEHLNPETMVLLKSKSEVSCKSSLSCWRLIIVQTSNPQKLTAQRDPNIHTSNHVWKWVIIPYTLQLVIWTFDNSFDVICRWWEFIEMLTSISKKSM